MRPRPVITLTLLAALVAAGVGFQPGREPVAAGAQKKDHSPQMRNIGEAVPTAAARRPRPADVAAVSADALPIASLRGSTVDGRVQLDAQQRLVIDVALRRFLDYFLSAAGERELAELRARALAASGLPAPARAELGALFDRYVAYLQDTAAPAPVDAELALRQRRRLHFGTADAAALFADLEAVADAARARRATAAPVEAALQPSREWQELGLLEAHWQMLTPAARQAEREAAYGTQAAARLAALDAREAQWQQRVAQLRARLQGQHSAQALETELARGYTPAEQRRLRALFAVPVQ